MSERFKILIGVPSSGQISESAAQASYLASFKHDVERTASCDSGPNFNRCWTTALNGGQAGKYTHFAMLHADIAIMPGEDQDRWADCMVEEMEAHEADFISTPMAIKDHRGLTSSGVGNPDNRWNPWKRFTVAELEKLPVTFSIHNTAYRDKFLLHNHALCMWDLRKPRWYRSVNGVNRFTFNFEEKIELVNGVWRCTQESEDWAYSRRLWEDGARTFISRRIRCLHHGGMSFANWGESGTWKVDHDTESQWKESIEPEADPSKSLQYCSVGD